MNLFRSSLPPCALAAGGLALLATVAFGQPMSAVMGVEPSSLDFGALPIGFDGELSLSLSNRASDPRSLLRVLSIQVSGNGFNLLRGPALPDTIPGGSTTDPVVVRFSPEGYGDMQGLLRITAANAQSFDVVLRGGGPPQETDIVADILLGPETNLTFKGIQGDFDLQGGDRLHFEWTGGVVYLNGKRHMPPYSLREYSEWRGPFTRAELLQYANVPFFQQRVALYGDNDVGWARAYAEWDSTKLALLDNLGGFHSQQHSMAECAEHVLREDTVNIVESARGIEGDGVEVVWRGLSGAETIVLPWHREPQMPRPVPRQRAEFMLRELRSFLETDQANTVELAYGDFSGGPSRLRRNGQSQNSNKGAR